MLKKIIAKISSCLDRLAPEQPAVPLRKALTISISVGFVVFLIVFMNRAYGTLEFNESMVLAVFGVSGLLIFLYPNSELYAPLTILEANLLAAFVGLSCVYAIPSTLLGLIVSIICTTLGLYFLNCMHPPALFLSLVIVIAGVESLDFALYPVLVDSVLLAMASHLYRKFLKH